MGPVLLSVKDLLHYLCLSLKCFKQITKEFQNWYIPFKFTNPVIQTG